MDSLTLVHFPCRTLLSNYPHPDPERKRFLFGLAAASLHSKGDCGHKAQRKTFTFFLKYYLFLVVAISSGSSFQRLQTADRNDL